MMVGFFFARFSYQTKDGCSVSDCKKNDGLGRIRTGDLRRVKTEDLALRVAFSDFSALSSVTVARADETTT